VTTDLPLGTFYVTMAYVEPSPDYANDDTVFVATASEWLRFVNPCRYDLSLWRQAPTGPDGAVVWERLLQEGTSRFGLIPGGKTAIANPGIFLNAPASTTGTTLPPRTWVPKVDPAFETTNFMFLLAGVGGADSLWYSSDRGDTWHPASQMPPVTTAVALSETGWCVVDTNTVLAGDSDGWVYKTTNRGNSWSDGAFTDLGVITDLNVSPIYSEAGGVGSDKAVIAGVTYTGIAGAPLGQPRTINEVWISFDGAYKDFTIVCSELMWDPLWGAPTPIGRDGILFTTANFDADWDTNSVVYGAASGAMDHWLWNVAGTDVTLQDTSEVGVYRAVVNVVDTQASTWELLYGADDFIAEAPTPEDGCIRYLDLSDLTIGNDGTIYVPFALFHDDSPVAGGLVSPSSIMRFTLGGMVRCLDGTPPTTEWSIVPQVLGPFDGLWLLPAVPGSNILFSAAWDVVDWRFKLATYEDTLSDAGPAPGAPLDGDTNIGTIINNKVQVPLSWADVGADTYEFQVATDRSFTSPITTMTSDTSATVTGLESGVKYYWRVRATDPVLGAWSEAQSFTTVVSAEVEAPKLLSPVAGAEVADLTPAFSWSAIAWATNYQIQVATDSGFTDKVIDETTDATAYEPDDELESGTTYYWRVKATSDSKDSGWSASVFTAGPAPEATPGWVWAVIAIGAVLLIAVLVLIMRTRRPA